MRTKFSGKSAAAIAARAAVRQLLKQVGQSLAQRHEVNCCEPKSKRAQVAGSGTAAMEGKVGAPGDIAVPVEL